MNEREREKLLTERAVKLAESLSEIPLPDALFVMQVAEAILSRRDLKADMDDRDGGELWKADA